MTSHSVGASSAGDAQLRGPARRNSSGSRPALPVRVRGNRQGRAWVRAGIFLALMTGAAAGARPREEFTKTFQKSLSIQPGQSLSLDHKFGSVSIRTHSSSQVDITASIRVAASTQSEASSSANQINIDVRQTATGVAIQTQYPERRGGIFSGQSGISYSVDYSIVVPESAPVQVKNSFGNLTVAGLKAKADLHDSHGSVELTGAAGPSSVSNSFGTVKVIDINGDLTVTNQNGPIDAKNISGGAELNTSFASVTFYGVGGRLSVSATNSSVTGGKVGAGAFVRTTFGAVAVSDVGGNTEIQNSNGKIVVKDIRGNAILRTSFGEIEATGISGTATVNDSNASVRLTNVDGYAEVHSTFGRVDLSGLRQGARVVTGNASVSLSGVNGDTYVKTSFGLVKAEHVGGSLTIENTNGGVRGAGIKGGAEIRTSFGPVILEGVGGPVRVDSQNGSVEVSGVAARSASGGCNGISLRTSFAPIKVALSPEGGYNVTARTSFGRISSELPVTVSSTTNFQSLAGTIGKGDCELSLTNANGSIDILKALAKK